jgi:hypothetical protein
VSNESSGKQIIAHNGAFFLGAGTAVRFSPSDQLGIAVITNALPTGLAEAITTTFFDLYQYGKPNRDWLASFRPLFHNLIEQITDESTDYSKLKPPVHPAPSGPLSAYVGTYRNDYYGQIEISADRGNLWMRLPPEGALYTLMHWDGQTFTYRYKGDPGKTARGVKFTLTGTPRVLIENLAEGNPTFARINR